MQTIEKLKQMADALRERQIPQPEQEAEAIMLHVTGMDRVTLLRDNPELSKKEVKDIDQCLFRRLKREPLQYITGVVDFLDLRIKIGKGVLIPRPETELLVEEVLRSRMGDPGYKSDRNASSEKLSILDVCTGSGCIALAIASHMPQAEVYATDMSGAALEYAEENARLNAIKNVTFLQGNLFDPVKEKKFHIIVSNPPYVRTSDIQILQEEIRLWEPLDAFEAGEDGLDYYRKIIRELDRHLLEEGRCFMEIGVGQEDALKSLAKDYGFKTSFKKDFSGYERIMILFF